MSATPFNLREDDVKDVAYAIRRRAVMAGCAVLVYVRDSGVVESQRVDRELRERPTDWLVGSYTRKARLEEIAEDLGERLREIRA